MGGEVADFFGEVLGALYVAVDEEEGFVYAGGVAGDAEAFAGAGPAAEPMPTTGRGGVG